MRCKGFTFIELLFVVAIIGILAAVAIPSYSGYVKRAKLVEAAALTTEIKNSINEYYHYYGYFPKDNDAAGVAKPEKISGNYVQSVQIENGAIHIKLSREFSRVKKDSYLSFQPLVAADNPIRPLSWLCGKAAIPAGLRAGGANKTNLENSVLSAGCRD